MSGSATWCGPLAECLDPPLGSTSVEEYVHVWSSQVFVYSDHLGHKRRGVYKIIKNSVNKTSNCSQSLKQPFSK